MPTAMRRRIGHIMLDLEERQEVAVKEGDYEGAITLHAAIDALAHALTV